MTSPGRSMLDLCGDGCGGSPPRRPQFLIKSGGELTLSVLYAKNMMPTLPVSKWVRPAG